MELPTVARKSARKTTTTAAKQENSENQIKVLPALTITDRTNHRNRMIHSYITKWMVGALLHQK